MTTHNEYDYRRVHLTKAEQSAFIKLLENKGSGFKNTVLIRMLESNALNSNTHKRLLAKYLEHLEKYSITPQERWAIFSGEKGICENPGCGNHTKWHRKGFSRFCCKKCAGPNTVEGRKATCLKRYGVDHVSKVPEITKKMSKGIRAAHAAKGHVAKRKGKFSYQEQKVKPNTGNLFYTYVLLDPRKPGPFKYGYWKFEYEPFYVGKGKGGRAFSHLKTFDVERSANKYKKNKIRAIVKENLQPIIKIQRKDISESEAFYLEAKLIHTIGCGNQGPLTNVMRVSTGGCSGFTHTKRVRQLLSEKSKISWDSQTKAQRKARCSAISKGKGCLTFEEYLDELHRIFDGRVSANLPKGKEFRMSHRIQHTCSCGTVRNVSPRYILTSKAKCQKCSREGKAGALRYEKVRKTRARNENV